MPLRIFKWTGSDGTVRYTAPGWDTALPTELAGRALRYRLACEPTSTRGKQARQERKGPAMPDPDAVNLDLDGPALAADMQPKEKVVNQLSDYWTPRNTITDIQP